MTGDLFALLSKDTDQELNFMMTRLRICTALTETVPSPDLASAHHS